MRVERARGHTLQVTAHATELATLIAAARWALDGQGQLEPAARDQLQRVLASYDRALAGLRQPAEAPSS